MSGGWRRVVAIAVPVVALVAIGAWLWVGLTPTVTEGPFGAPGPGVVVVPRADGRDGTWAMTGTSATIVQSLTNDSRVPITVEAGGEVADLSLAVSFQPQWGGAQGIGTLGTPTVASVTVEPGYAVGVVITVTAPPCDQRSTDGSEVLDSIELRVRSLGLPSTQRLVFDDQATLTVLGRPGCRATTP